MHVYNNIINWTKQEFNDVFERAFQEFVLAVNGGHGILLLLQKIKGTLCPFNMLNIWIVLQQKNLWKMW